MAGGRAEGQCSGWYYAGLCADIITILTLHVEVERNKGTHYVFSAQGKLFHFFYDLHSLFEFTFCFGSTLSLCEEYL